MNLYQKSFTLLHFIYLESAKKFHSESIFKESGSESGSCSEKGEETESTEENANSVLKNIIIKNVFNHIQGVWVYFYT